MGKRTSFLSTIASALETRGVSEDQILRHVVMRPYRKGMGPTFRLVTWDTYNRRGGRDLVGYALFASDATEPVFAGTDYGPSPMSAIDSDAALRDLLGFLTLRPGDTDCEFFETYTPAQHAFAAQHAETLGLYALEEDAARWDRVIV